MRWQTSLRLHGSADWVIVVVETNDAKKKNKTNILPRSSIVDKIRNDFCNKQSDRYGDEVLSAAFKGHPFLVLVTRVRGAVFNIE